MISTEATSRSNGDILHISTATAGATTGGNNGERQQRGNNGDTYNLGNNGDTHNLGNNGDTYNLDLD